MVALAACETTEQKAQRLAITNARTVQARKAIRIRQVDRDVKVIRATAVRGTGKSAVVVELRNNGSTPINDLPLAVGLRVPGRTPVILNEKVSSYFQSHAPALAPGAQGTWVLITKDKIPDGGTTFAKVGVAARKPLVTADNVPTLTISGIKAATGKSPAIDAEIENTSGLPQYDLAVYAWARKGDRLVAAGALKVPHIGTGESLEVRIPVIGRTAGADLQVTAPPTVFE